MKNTSLELNQMNGPDINNKLVLNDLNQFFGKNKDQAKNFKQRELQKYLFFLNYKLQSQHSIQTNKNIERLISLLKAEDKTKKLMNSPDTVQKINEHNNKTRNSIKKQTPNKKSSKTNKKLTNKKIKHINKLIKTDKQKFNLPIDIWEYSGDKEIIKKYILLPTNILNNYQNNITQSLNHTKKLEENKYPNFKAQIENTEKDHLFYIDYIKQTRKQIEENSLKNNINLLLESIKNGAKSNNITQKNQKAYIKYITIKENNSLFNSLIDSIDYLDDKINFYKS